MESEAVLELYKPSIANCGIWHIPFIGDGDSSSHYRAPEFVRRQECVRQQREWEQIFEALYESTKVIC